MSKQGKQMKKQGKQNTNSKDFCTVWKVDAGGEIDFETQGSYTIDWGDGCIEQIKSIAVGGKVNHVYAAAGEYNVKISSKITKFRVGWHTKELIEIKQWGAARWKTMAWMFAGAENMICTATDTPNTSKVASMSAMFSRCKKFNSPIEHWDTKAVEDMTAMLSHAQMFNRSLANMDLSSVEYVDYMLNSTHAFDQDLRDLNIGAKVDTDKLFGQNKSLADYNEKYGVQEEKQAVYSVLDGAGAILSPAPAGGP